MLAFQSSEGCQAYINDSGCLVIKQWDRECGESVMVILTPAMAWEIARMIDDFHDEMVFTWADGLIQKSNEQLEKEVSNGPN
jgi:hypothetical protein